MASVVLENFDAIDTTSGITVYNNVVRGNWFFFNNAAGVLHSSNQTGLAAPSGLYAGVVEVVYSSSRTLSYMYTVMTGLTVGETYTLSFSNTLRNFQCGPDMFYVNVYDGTTTSLIWFGRPTARNWVTRTCTPFTATQSSMMLLFVARAEAVDGFYPSFNNVTGVAIDNVAIAPGAGVSLSATGVAFANAAIARPLAVQSSLIGEFEGVFVQSLTNNHRGLVDNWFSFGGYGTNSFGPGNTGVGNGSYLSYHSLRNYTNNANTRAMTYMYTILQNLNTSTTYTLSFSIGTRRPGLSLHCWNLWDGTNTTTIHDQAIPGTAEWSSRTATFVPTQSQMMLVFSAAGFQDTDYDIYLDAISISPWQGLDRSGVSSIVFTPLAMRNSATTVSALASAPTLSVYGGNGFGVIYWTPPANTAGQPIHFYAYSYVASNSTTSTFNTTPRDSRAQLLTNLTNGVAYTVTLCAVTTAGVGQASVVTFTPTAAAPTPSPSALTSGVIGDFERALNTTNGFTSINGSADNWFFSTDRAGVSLAVAVTSLPNAPTNDPGPTYPPHAVLGAASGVYALALLPSFTQPTTYAYTVLSGLTPSVPYTVSFWAALQSNTLVSDALAVSVYDGLSTTVIWTGAPQAPTRWNKCTCASFTPTRRKVMIVFTSYFLSENSYNPSSRGALIDLVEITPFSGLSQSSTGLAYAPEASPPPTVAVAPLASTIVFSSESGMHNSPDGPLNVDGAIDNVFYSVRAGFVDYTAFGTTGGPSPRFAVSLRPNSTFGQERVSYVYTVLRGLSVGTVYTIRFHATSAGGGPLASTITTVNAYDGTTTQTIWAGSIQNVSTWQQRQGTFTATASTTLIVIAVAAHQQDAGPFIQIDDLSITPFSGLSRFYPGIRYVPQAARNTLASSGTPSAPTITSLSNPGGTAIITVAFSAPASDGGSAVRWYVIMYEGTNGSRVILHTYDSASFSWAIPSMPSGVGFTFRVAAHNAAGAGAFSAPVTGTIPVAVSAATSVAGPQGISVSWTTTNTGADVSYNVRYVVAGNTTTLTGFAGPDFAFVQGLSVGQAHTVSVAVVTNLGTSNYTAAGTVTPTAALPALTTTLYSGFNNLNAGSTSLSGSFGEWRFATSNVGVWQSSQFGGQTGIEGSHVAYMSDANQRMWTYMTGLTTGTSYTVSFLVGKRTNSIFPNIFYVNAYDGTTVTTLFAGRPAFPNFTSVTCEAFVATGPVMLIVFGSTNNFVAFDAVRITPFENVVPSPIGPIRPVAASLAPPATLFSDSIGVFEGLSTNDSGAVYLSNFEFWTGVSAGTLLSTGSGGPGVAAPQGTMAAFLDTTTGTTTSYMFTVLGGLSMTTSYTVSFAMSAIAGGSFTLPDRFLLNVYDGVDTETLHNGLPSATPGYVTRTVSFTPSSRTVMLIFVATQTGAGNRRIAIDNIKLSPFSGISRSATGIAFAPAAAQLVITGVPGAPRNLAATPGVGQMTLSWALPEDQGLSLVSSYRIVVTGGITQTLTGITETSRTITGLATGVSYTFAVSAINAQGTGQPATVTMSPATPSEAVSGNVVATSSTLQHTWTPSAGEPAVTYVVYRDNVSIQALGNTARSFTHTGLAAATTYTLGVAATSLLGLTTRSNVVATTRPNPPQVDPFLFATGNTITASWFPPLVGGNGITGYNVYLDGVRSGNTVAANVSRANVTGLTQGTSYNVGVSALTSGGEGLMANRAAVTVPAAPGNVRVSGTPGFRDMPVAWDPPTVGGNARSGYFVRGNGVVLATVTDANATFANVTGLAGNTSYSVRVQAYNAAGAGETSDPPAVITTAATNPDLYTFIAEAVTLAPPVRPNTASSRLAIQNAVLAERALAFGGNAVGNAATAEAVRETANVVPTAFRAVASTQTNRRRVLRGLSQI